MALLCLGDMEEEEMNLIIKGRKMENTKFFLKIPINRSDTIETRTWTVVLNLF